MNDMDQDKRRRAIRSYRIGMVCCAVAVLCALIVVIF